MVYFGASYGASDFGGNMYLVLALTSLVEIPANLLAVDNCERCALIILIVFIEVLTQKDKYQPKTTRFCQQVATNLTISSSCNKSGLLQFVICRLVTTC